MLATVVTVPVGEAEIAADALWSLGVVAIEERVLPRSSLIELWTSLGDDGDTAREALADLAWPWRFEDVDEGVVDTWRDHAQPSWVAADVVIVPAWKRAPTVDEGVTTIAIDPGATFGMGDHPTTVLSMQALRAADVQGARVLDVGCGSGVLAVAACCFGAGSVVAIDIAPAAVPATIENARRNGVADRVSASTTPLVEIDAAYDIVVANILAPVLVALADDLQRVLAPDGTLIISGVLAERHEHVLAALEPLRQVERRDRDGWSAITLRR